MRRHRVFDVIQALVGYSTDFSGSFLNPVDLLFIDGNHDYAAVLRDYLDWSPKLRVGGVMALHDVVYAPKNDDAVGPGLVAKELVVGNATWSEVRLVGSLLCARRAV
jgi:predicted O-methyltransferase YrrM